MSKKTELSAEAQRILKEDLDYLSDMCIHTSEGKRFLGTKDKAFNIEWRMSESEFVKRWLIQFALGNGSGINYFNVNEWMKHTNKGQGLVEIFTDRTDTEEPVSLLIIPPMMAVNMTNADYQLIRHAVGIINCNIADEQSTRRRDSNKPIADELATLLANKRVAIPENIPEWFYERHGIVPLVEQQCFFIRDVVNADTPYPHEDYYRLRDILYKKHRNEMITEEEKTFAVTLSRDTLEWETSIKENSEDNATNEEDNAGYDPLSC